MPSVEPMPLPPTESRLAEPLDAQEASYFAASARMVSLRSRSNRRSVEEEGCGLYIKSGYCWQVGRTRTAVLRSHQVRLARAKCRREPIGYAASCAATWIRLRPERLAV